MSEEKMRILQMIQEGKVNAAEGLELLQALDESNLSSEVKQVPVNTRLANRFLRVRVNASGVKKVNVNIPLSLVKIASKFAGLGINYIPESARQEMLQKGIDLSKIDFEELVLQIEQGLVDGKLVDVDVDDPAEGPVKVEVYVD